LKINHVANRQHGHVTRAQLLALGMRDRMDLLRQTLAQRRP
jgi:hypothetical protein